MTQDTDMPSSLRVGTMSPNNVKKLKMVVY